MLVIVEKVVSIFLVLAVGFCFLKFKIFKPEAKQHLSKFLLQVALPCMILASMTKNTLTDDSLSETLGILGLASLYFLVVSIIGFLMAKYVYKVPKEDLGTYVLLIGSNNSGFLGFPVSSAIFGESILFLMIIFNIVLTVYANSIGPVVIGMGDDQNADYKKAIKNFFNVNTICSIIGLVMYFSRIHFPEMIFNTLDTLGDVTVPLSLFVIGMQLAESDFKELFSNYKLLISVVLKMTLVPLAVFFIVRGLNISSNMKICLTLAATLPTAAIITSIAQVQGKNAKLCAEFTSLATLLSVATIPIMATILTSTYLS